MIQEMIWEAEAAVIGGLIADFPIAKKALVELVATEFYFDDTRALFSAIKAVSQRNEPVDAITVLTETGQDPELKVSLARCAETLPSMGNYESYINIVREHAQRRRISKEIQDLSWGDMSASELLSRLKGITEREQVTDTAFKENMMLYKLGLYRGRLSEDISKSKIPTGYDGLDNMLGQLARRNFTVIGARPGMGKTAFAGCLGLNFAKKGKRVAFFSLEMPDEQLLNRLAANLLSIEHNRFRDNKLSRHEKDAAVNALSEVMIDNAFFIFDDVYSIERIESLVAQCQADVVIIDYLQLVDTAQASDKDLERVSQVSRACKRMAKQYDCHVIALAQLSRSVESRRIKIPRLSDLRDCGQIEQDADTVIFLYRAYIYNKQAEIEKASVIVAKNRHGETGTLEFRFQGQYQRFVQVDKKHEEFRTVARGPWPPRQEEHEQTKL